MKIRKDYPTAPETKSCRESDFVASRLLIRMIFNEDFILQIFTGSDFVIRWLQIYLGKEAEVNVKSCGLTRQR